jgi:hypothetical protein
MRGISFDEVNSLVGRLEFLVYCRSFCWRNGVNRPWVGFEEIYRFAFDLMSYYKSIDIGLFFYNNGV